MTVAQITDKIPHKRWLRIIPPAIMVYVFSYMDRANLGFAIAGGMLKDLHVTATVAGTAAGMFSIGYLFLQIPGGHFAARGKAKLFITLSILVWGVVATMLGFVTGAWQLLTLRFLLGVFEGGTFPAMLVLVTNWFPIEERARANAMFMMSNAVGYMLTGPVSGLIISKWSWRQVFVIEGLLTIALVIIWWPIVNEKPEDAKWLSTMERDFLVQKSAEERERLKANKAAVRYGELLAHPDLWKLAAIYFCIQIGVTGYSIWLPTLVKTLTKTGMATTGILSGLPYAASMFGMYSFAAFSDRTGNRRFYAGFPALCFALCFLFSTQTKSYIWVSYGFLLACGFFQQAHNPTFWSIPPILFTKEVAGGARGLINGIGNLGGFFGPVLVGWFITVFHNTDYGLYGLACFLVIAFLLTFTLPARLTKPVAEKESAASA